MGNCPWSILLRRRTTLSLPADPAATEHGRQAARSVVDRGGGKVRSVGAKPPQAAS